MAALPAVVTQNTLAARPASTNGAGDWAWQLPPMDCRLRSSARCCSAGARGSPALCRRAGGQHLHRPARSGAARRRGRCRPASTQAARATACPTPSRREPGLLPGVHDLTGAGRGEDGQPAVRLGHDRGVAGDRAGGAAERVHGRPGRGCRPGLPEWINVFAADLANHSAVPFALMAIEMRGRLLVAGGFGGVGPVGAPPRFTSSLSVSNIDRDAAVGGQVVAPGTGESAGGWSTCWTACTELLVVATPSQSA